MANDAASPDALIDLNEVPLPFWRTREHDDVGYVTDLMCHDHDEYDFCAYTRCAICGLHITDKYAPNGGWANEVLMVGDLSREYEYVQTYRKYPTSCQDPAVFSAQIAWECSFVKGSGYYLGPDGKGPCFAYAADTNPQNGGPDGKNVVYLPMHRACFHIALQSPRWDETSSTPLRALFRVLRHRFQVKWEQCLRRYPYEHEKYWLSLSNKMASIKMIGFQNTQGIERGYFSKEFLDWGFWKEEPGSYNPYEPLNKDHYLIYDPLNIPSLTDTLLKNLERRISPEDTKKNSPLRKRVRTLPDDLKLLIYEYLVQDQEWPLECTRLFGPGFWKALFNRDIPCMGWLWDLDFELIRRTDPGLRMDWELLFRKLSQGPRVPDCIGEHADSDYEIFRGFLTHVPPGLEGRRRAWKLVEEMRIGDRSVHWEITPEERWIDKCEVIRDLAEVPVYWGGDGEPLDEEELPALVWVDQDDAYTPFLSNAGTLAQ